MTDAEEPKSKPRLQQGLGSAATLMVFATLASSITGLMRQMVFSHEFGTTPEFAAYIQAFRIPDLFYFLVAGGALRTGFIPVFTKYMEEGRPDKAWRTFSVTFTLLLFISAVGVAIGMAAAPWLVKHVVAIELDPAYHPLCARLMRAMFPAQVFFILGGLLMGTLNARKHFTMPAMGPIVYNLVIIAGALASLPLARRAGLEVEADQLPYRLWCLSLTIVIGAAVGSFIIQTPPLLKLGARLKPAIDFADEGLRSLVGLALPVVLSLAVSEINFVIATSLAGDDTVLLEYPNRVIKLPPRMFGAGLAMALFPYLASHFARADMDAYRRDLARFMRAALLLSIPSMVICVTLAVPTMRLLFERGLFTAEDTQATAAVMVWCSLGIAFLSLQYISARGFYALHETKVPLYVGAATAGLGIVLALLVYRPWGVQGLAAILSVTYLFNAVLLTWLLRRRVGPLEGRKMARMLGQTALPCVVLGCICWFGSDLIEGWLGTATLAAKMAAFLVPLGVGLAIFLLLCVILKVEDLQTARNLAASRFRRRSAGRKPSN